MTHDTRITEGLDTRITESGDTRITEDTIETEIIIKYELQGSSAIRERPAFDFEYQQTIYVVLE